MTKFLAAPMIAALALAAGLPAQAQTTVKTTVSHDTSMTDAGPTRTTKVTHVVKRKTHRPKKILGVKVGHKTVTRKIERKTTTSADGGMSTQVKTSH
ncbi:MAG: hypothetical protein ACRYFW_08285 [Janthinobacterium lividum]